MKTFTKCAEKKAKQFLNLLQGYTKGIRITAILILLLMGVSNAWAVDHTGGYVYFLKPSTWTESKVMMFIGHNSYTSVYEMTKVSNTDNLYRYTMPSWGGATYVAFANAGSVWGSGSWGPSNRTNATHYTNVYNNYGFNSGSYYVVVPASTSNNAGITINYKSSASNLNLTTKANVYGSTDGGSTYSSMAAAGTVSVSGYYMSNYSTASTRSAVSSTASQAYASTTLAPGSTAKFTATAKTGYEFVGWFSAESGGTAVSTSSTYNYAYDISYTGKTLYARFDAISYTITYKDQGGSDFSGTHASGYPTSHTYSVATTLKNPTKAGYTFEGWFTNSDCTGTAVTSLGATDYTADITLYAKWTQNATYSLDVQAGTGIASVTGSTDPVTLGSTYAITATPKTGYTFSTWTANPAANATFGSATTANTTVTVKNGSVTVTASATENMSTLTTSNQYDAGDPGYEVPEASVNSIGYETTATITATNDDDYTLTSWTLTNCTRTDGGADNATTITVRSNGDGKAATVTANYTENPCVYFVNTERWTNVYIHAWKDGGDGTTWPGTKLTDIVETINGFQVYKYILPDGKDYDQVIFNNGEGTQTADLAWENGKYYVYSAGAWVDKAEVEDNLPSTTIYFKNNPGWEKVYVYFFTGEDYGDLGASSSGLTETNKRCCAMTQIGTTDVWKYDYGASGVVPGNVIAFTEAKQPNYGNFYDTKAAYRTDFNNGMELFIPQEASNETKNSTKYYNKGLWMKYNSTESGYTITGNFNGWNQESDKFTSETSGGYIFQKELLLSSGNSYEFKIKNIKNDWFRTSTAITSTKNTDIEFTAGDGNNVTITALSDGYYIFSIDLSTGKMLVSVEYPLMVGDYRLVYVESETLGTPPYTKYHAAQSIRKVTTDEHRDTISFYINKTGGQNPAILLQQCTEVDGANITWGDIAIQYINGNSGTDPANSLLPTRRNTDVQLYIGYGCSEITENGVYNFILEQSNTPSHSAQISEEVHPYEGDYYIRTDAAEGGWSKYNTNPDNIMTHSLTALTHGGYDYYFCSWVLEENNVNYVVANKYSYCVSDTLKKDDFTDDNGNLLHNANVRYTWNSSTNALARAYINGSSAISDRYLVLEGNSHLQDANGTAFNISGLNANEANFQDMGNWLYQLDVKANDNTEVKLTANYNSIIQYFKGKSDSTVTLISGAESRLYKIRLIYDFKTNYLLCALIDNDEIAENISVDEAMIIRSHHDDAQTFTVASGKQVTTIKTIYGVMTFNKDTLNASTSQYERALYWVSFPFDVNLEEAFGFGNYGEHWIMEYYDGAERAKIGMWSDVGTYWRYIENPKGVTLKAGVGYVLCLDLDLLKTTSAIFNHSDEIALYFPSSEENLTITSDPTIGSTEVPQHDCTIERDDRYIEDDNWNIVGVPAYTNHDFSYQPEGRLGFYYQYNSEDNTYTPKITASFNCMHAYMVQFAGEINWDGSAIVPLSIAARKQSASKNQYTLRLALQQEGKDHDHTFIRLQENNVSPEFDMNYDLCKIINRGANIYSLIGNVEVAANVLPVEERVIPLGLDIEDAGSYTFAMPDGTDGITALLIDYETNTETNLLFSDYTVDLDAGINQDRFAIRVRPSSVATTVETINDQTGDKSRKYIINGALYLLRDGQLFDAQGRVVANF